MPALLRIAAVTTAAGLLMAPVAGAASAATSRSAAAGGTTGAAATSAAKVRLRGGTTSVTTAPGIATALLGNGIAPIATWPGRESLRSPKSSPAVRFSFPVTGGRLA